MTLHQLQVFLSVVDTGSFARGAQAVMLSQPTVSQHIAALENELGVVLLERSRKPIALTEAGKLLRRHARQVVAEADGARRALERFRGMDGVPLRIGASTIPGTYMVPRVMPILFQKFPGLQLVLLQGDSRDTLDRVGSDEVEIGLIGSRFEERGLSYLPVGRDIIRLVVGPAHVWARQGAVALSDLLSQPLVLREAGSGTGKTVGEALRRAGLDTAKLQMRAEVGSTEGVKAAVAAGVGAAFLSEFAIRSELERGDLATVFVEGLSIERTFYLVRRATRGPSPAAQAFCDVMQAAYAEPSAPASIRSPLQRGT